MIDLARFSASSISRSVRSPLLPPKIQKLIPTAAVVPAITIPTGTTDMATSVPNAIPPAARPPPMAFRLPAARSTRCLSTPRRSSSVSASRTATRARRRASCSAIDCCSSSPESTARSSPNLDRLDTCRVVSASICSTHQLALRINLLCASRGHLKMQAVRNRWPDAQGLVGDTIENSVRWRGYAASDSSPLCERSPRRHQRNDSGPPGREELEGPAPHLEEQGFEVLGERGIGKRAA